MNQHNFKALTEEHFNGLSPFQSMCALAFMLGALQSQFDTFEAESISKEKLHGIVLEGLKRGKEIGVE